MREIKNWINSQNMSLTLTAESELGTISAMLELVRQSSAVRNVEALAKNILQQEIMSPSASGYCSVLFRALQDSVIEPQIFFGRFDKGIGYYSKNGHPIDLIFLIIAPPTMENEFNTMVQKMEQAIFNALFREKLRETTSAKQVLEILIEELT